MKERINNNDYVILINATHLTSVELASLGPLLSQIVVALTPLINKFPEIISGILQYLIVEHK